jgi:hypothetical protein
MLKHNFKIYFQKIIRYFASKSPNSQTNRSKSLPNAHCRQYFIIPIHWVVILRKWYYTLKWLNPKTIFSEPLQNLTKTIFG